MYIYIWTYVYIYTYACARHTYTFIHVIPFFEIPWAFSRLTIQRLVRPRLAPSWCLFSMDNASSTDLAEKSRWLRRSDRTVVAKVALIVRWSDGVKNWNLTSPPVWDVENVENELQFDGSPTKNPTFQWVGWLLGEGLQLLSITWDSPKMTLILGIFPRAIWKLGTWCSKPLNLKPQLSQDVRMFHHESSSPNIGWWKKTYFGHPWNNVIKTMVTKP